jgi:hypothetical protein
LIASVCDKRTYQDVIKAYSEHFFPRASGLNLLSLIYSNQAENTIKHGGKSLTSVNQPGAPTEMNWTRNLTAVVSNKVDDWSQLARHIGDRIIQESGVSFLFIYFLNTLGCPCCSFCLHCEWCLIWKK